MSDTQILAHPWLASYPPGVPAEINPEAFTSLNAMFAKAIAENGSAKAFSCLGSSLTFADVGRLSRDFAAYLVHDLKLSKGDRVAMMMPNILPYPIAVLGVLQAGMVVVNCNPMYTARELEHQLKDSGARAIVIVENVAHTLAQCIKATSIVQVISTEVGDLLGFPKALMVNSLIRYVKKAIPAWDLPGSISMNSALARGRKQLFEPATVAARDIAFLQYTGGTTGVSKGAVLTHRNLVANIQQVSTWTCMHLKAGRETVIQPLPMYHIFALNCAMNFFSQGFHTVLIPDPRNMDSFLKELRAHKFSVLTGVNTLFNGLVNHPEFAKLDFSNLRLSLGGGMAVQRVVADKWRAVTGRTLIEAYGLTETSPAATANPLDMVEFNGCIGMPVPSTIVTIRDDAENILGPGQSGEICIEGPQVMQGYWQRPDESAKVFCKDGAFKTGDIGIMDEKGYFKIVDRKKDMILVSGFNVYPNEIEDVVAMCPGVREVCAVSMKDEKSGEAVRVVIVKADAALTGDAVKAFCKERLTGYKMPRLIEFWKDLPKTNVGKILRREVRDTPPKDNA